MAGGMSRATRSPDPPVAKRRRPSRSMRSHVATSSAASGTSVWHQAVAQPGTQSGGGGCGSGGSGSEVTQRLYAR
eukprot:scaffold84918_cov42-Phaeocystis_antarctica.AAC.1